MINWIAPVCGYLWLAGIAGGAYFATFLVERFTGEANGKLLRLATYLGIPLVTIGVILLVIDLGMPLRFWHFLFSFRIFSPMSMGTWILMVWVCIAVIMVILWFVEQSLSLHVVRILRRGRGVLAWFNLVFAVLLMSYTGVLLATSNQPLWSGTFLLPCLFVVSATSTGVAMVIAAALITNAISRRGPAWLKRPVSQLFGSTDMTIPNRTLGRLAETDAIIILIEILVLIGYAVSLSMSTMAGAGEALRLLTTGVLAGPFWLGLVLLALLVPLGLDIASWGKEIEKKAVWRAIMASSACVVLGGLVLRAVILIGGQI